jgi:hypothetical protein
LSALASAVFSCLSRSSVLTSACLCDSRKGVHAAAQGNDPAAERAEFVNAFKPGNAFQFAPGFPQECFMPGLSVFVESPLRQPCVDPFGRNVGLNFFQPVPDLPAAHRIEGLT